MNGPIVVGTDGSESATAAVIDAIKLAKALDEPLHIISAYKPVPMSGSDLPPEFAASVNSRSQVDSILNDVGSRSSQAGVKAELHAVTGDAANAILSLAEELDAGLIVVGNKGLGSLKRFVLGNVPSKIVHNSPCSVHIVHTTD
jgi:nucleotide-binding universal stress UspA family protein